MSDILKEFNVFSEISEEFKQNIQLFHVFSDNNFRKRGINVLFVTNKDQVFSFGQNSVGECGFGHNDRLDTPQQIPELCGKQIKQFFIGYDFVFALNQQNQVLSWGTNVYGQLGRGFTNDTGQYLKPEIIAELQNIISISCGFNHCLALDSKGNVFAWGYNGNGQVGCDDDQTGHFVNQLTSLENIIAIHCTFRQSFAVSSNGQVYGWGYNRDYCLGHDSDDKFIFQPKLINGLNNIKTVGYYSKYESYVTYFLTNDGNIYFCGKFDENSNEDQKTPKLLDTDLKFQFLKTINSIALGLSEETIYCLKDNTIKKTEFKTFFDYCLNEKQITIETIPIDFEMDYLLLGSGGFGTVYKWFDKTHQKEYAVKIILNQEKRSEYHKEVTTLSKCDHNYVVKYFNSWTKNNQFYIQMELCDTNLSNIIEEKGICFKRTESGNMSSVEYFICIQLIEEIVECVQYLHGLKPPIIHRDLKPANILINYQPINGRFIKLCDFGIATFGSDHTIAHTKDVGTAKYMAPEMTLNAKNQLRLEYNTRVDIYSLGVIFCDLFELDINFSNSKTELEKLTEQMLNIQYNNRPDCEQLLIVLSKISRSIYLGIRGKVRENIKQMSQYRNVFFLNYFQQKLSQLESLENNPTEFDHKLNIVSEIPIYEKTEGSDYNESLNYTVEDNQEIVEQTEQSFDKILEKLFSDPFSENLLQNFDSIFPLKEKSVLILTKDDRLFSFGDNFAGMCGFGHNDRVDIPQEITKLSGKQIKQFFIGSDFVLALNKQNQVFGWGMNNMGQLGRGYKSNFEDYLIPEIISSLKNITEISCGDQHTLALDSNGNVFGWGFNGYGQLGCGRDDVQYFAPDNVINEPVLITQLPKIKSIYCLGNLFINSSFAVTTDGLVYSWGFNYDYCLGHDVNSRVSIPEPHLINGLISVISVGRSENVTYFLTNESNIYFCGQIGENLYQKTPKLLDTDKKFQSIKKIDLFNSKYDTYSKTLALSEEIVYCLEENTIKKTEYKTFCDYCRNEKQKSLKNLNSYLLKSLNRYENISELGEGGFGTVIKAKDKLDDNIYSLKIMDINETLINVFEKEVQLLSKCSHQYVVKYYDSWIENEQFIIKMELCSDNLDNIVKKKNECFDRQPAEVMSLIEFFICSQLMRELLECVQYLHQLNPPIIHRDLKPENVLVNYEPTNQRYLKLCDFGLATHGSDHTISHTEGMGTNSYMAPEVIDGIRGKSDYKYKYSTKADVYSLGVILCEVFSLRINSSDMSVTKNNQLTNNWNELVKQIKRMLMTRYQERPTCNELLVMDQFWTIEKMTAKQIDSEEYKRNVKQMREFENQFFCKYFNEKIN